MSTQPKLWVFSSLVQDKEDPQQLIAYAIYKSHKEEKAQRLKHQGKSDDEIKAELEKWHDEVALDPRLLENYQEKALSIVDALIEGANQAAEQHFDVIAKDKIDALIATHSDAITTISARHQSEVDALKNQLAAAHEKARLEWANKIAQWVPAQHTPPAWKRYLIKFAAWLGAGVSGLLGTVITTVLIVGLCSLFVTKEDRAAMINSTLKKGIDMLVPEKPLDIPTRPGKPHPKEANPDDFSNGVGS